MLSPSSRQALLTLARSAVRAAASGRTFLLPPCPDPALASPAGAFVTLHASTGDLRGCIGYIEPRRALWETVSLAARAAAIEDDRFPPLAPGDVDTVSLEISVLSPAVPARPEDVQVGIHGIILSSGPRRGLLLPQVPVELGWDRDRFLDACCDKAGLPRGAWRRGATLETFTAEVFHE